MENSFHNIKAFKKRGFGEGIYSDKRKSPDPQDTLSGVGKLLKCKFIHSYHVLINRDFNNSFLQSKGKVLLE